ncbi:MULTISPECIES: ABC transporter substrate-binding protein [Actinoalloteichus]|uniref:ABC-type nitrate/sulfonate/bicarbonate transport system, periplasmic component n=1 Tax=Actinoalloteichus fjordicus TaxID=1612552 RepID=A0AAC9LK04_9PSEU|nr:MULTISPECIES: ABC transporter substrate-binding protein [Actinoalloteichus]APU17695.1 ABC-type nitrate/sulfonate/bicarbonate transport system, periplasmic component [Actinoalloteichus fjordicus]APU23773.1 ABC-type nitrate/sulfonate/bicarbonate transport system, periplasmic component [Actinoalloteichus sp. GBA129-24]
MAPRVGSGAPATKLARPARVATAIMATATLFATSACGLLDGSAGQEESSGDGGNGVVEQEVIRLGLLPVVDVASVHIAIEDGFFEEEGVEIELTSIQGAAAAMPGLEAGELDIVFGNWVSIFAAHSALGNIKLVADSYYALPNTWMVMTTPDSGLTQPEDLMGRTIGVTSQGSLAEVTIKSVLRANDLDPDNVSFVEMGYPDMAAALDSGQVDAALMAEPFITNAELEIGAVPVFDAASGPTEEIPIAGFAAKDEWAAENPQTVAAFQRAFSRGQEVASSDRERVEQMVQEYASIEPETASLLNLGGWPTTLEASRLQRIPNLMLEYELIDEPIEAESMILSQPRN